MASRSSAATTTSFLLVTFFFLFSSTAAAFNITRILDQTPDFSTFNNYLSQTKLAAEINRRRTITILAVDNAAVSAALSGQPLEIIREILSVHVILDYYDIPKLRGMKRRSTVLTSLFQSTGLADDEMGFVNLTKTPSGIRLGSAEPGAGLTVDLIKTVAARPYNISVLQVSGVIVPPGIRDMGDDIVTPPPPQTAPAPEKEAPAPAPEAESPDAVSPPAPSGPAEAPEAADVPAPAPASAPAPSEDASPAKAPRAADQESEAPIPSEESTSSATREAGLGSGIAAAVVGAAAAALLAAM